MSDKFKYKTVTWGWKSPGDMNDMLNNQGKIGWELVTVLTLTGSEAAVGVPRCENPDGCWAFIFKIRKEIADD